MQSEIGGRGSGLLDLEINMYGIKKLWVKVLTLAILDLAGCELGPKRAAKVWIKSDETRFQSFISICKALDIDYRRIRSMLLSKGVTRENFQIKTGRCCECGGYRPLAQLKRVHEDDSYLCKRCEKSVLM